MEAVHVFLKGSAKRPHPSAHVIHPPEIDLGGEISRSFSANVAVCMWPVHWPTGRHVAPCIGVRGHTVGIRNFLVLVIVVVAPMAISMASIIGRGEVSWWVYIMGPHVVFVITVIPWLVTAIS